MGLASLFPTPGRRRPHPALTSTGQGLVGAAVAAAAARTAYTLLTRATPDTAPARVPAPRTASDTRVLVGAAVTTGAPAHAAGPAFPGTPGGSGDTAGHHGAAVPGAAAPASGRSPDGSRPAGEPAAVSGTGAAGAPAPGSWWRTNFRGRRVTLQEGPALASGVCAASLLTPGLDPRVRAATALAAAGAAGFGAYDDLAGSADTRGLRGHLGALFQGRVTTGAVKMAGIGATGLAAAALLRRGPLDTLVDGALIAAGANLFNLFDLRPGRAVKLGLLAALPGLASPAAPALAPTIGACAALLPDDLAERSMLGDAGANALGAALGAAAAARAPRPVRLALLGGVVALTLASEVTSFSKVIDRVPPLRDLDRWGRCA